MSEEKCKRLEIELHDFKERLRHKELIVHELLQSNKDALDSDESRQTDLEKKISSDLNQVRRNKAILENELKRKSTERGDSGDSWGISDMSADFEHLTESTRQNCLMGV